MALEGVINKFNDTAEAMNIGLNFKAEFGQLIIDQLINILLIHEARCLF